MTNSSNKNGGYRSLVVYQLAVPIFDLTNQFCRQYLSDLQYRRTVEQMSQAARSGKQNIVEASLEKSLAANIKLTAVARASFGELVEDYNDFLRTRKFVLWNKDDSRLKPLRLLRATRQTDWPNWANWSDWTNDPERFANAVITLISMETYLLDQLIRALEKKFIAEGGFTENLHKKRLEARKKQLYHRQFE